MAVFPKVRIRSGARICARLDRNGSVSGWGARWEFQAEGMRKQKGDVNGSYRRNGK